MDQNILMQIAKDQASQMERLTSIDEKVNTCLGLLQGEQGMVVRVDRLEQSERRRGKIIWLLFVSIVALVGQAAASWLGLK
jgi:hypothetical protein